MIYLGADHGGYNLKNRVKDWLKQQSLQYMDMGSNTYNLEDDYPEFAFAVATQISANQPVGITWKDQTKGILFCRTGGGMVIAANKIKGIRAVLALNIEHAKKARETNDANILVIAADWISEPQTCEIIQTFLNTEFSKEERHVRRVEQIKRIEFGVK